MKRIFFLIIILLMSTTSFAADEWLKTRPQSTDLKIDWPTYSQANNAALDRVLSNYRKGMKLTYSSATTIAVGSGEVVCSNSAGTVRKMRANTSSTNVTFSDIDTGSEAGSTTYYLYANCDADAETATFKVSASSSAPTGVTYYKQLGSFYNDSSSNIDSTLVKNDGVLLDLQNIVENFGIYDSGWFAYTKNTSVSKTHNLGTQKVMAFVYYATSSSGAEATLNLTSIGEGGVGGLYNITTTACTLVTDSNAAITYSTGGARKDFTYARIILIPLE